MQKYRITLLYKIDVGRKSELFRERERERMNTLTFRLHCEI